VSDIDITGSISNEPKITGQFEPDIVIQGNVNSQFPAQVSVDSVTTGAPGTDASVVNVGTPGNARLQFTIPRGADGTPGANGAPGADGADGLIQSVVAGSNITVDNTDPANPVINSTASGDGDVVGPSSAVDGTPAVFDGTTGKRLKNITYSAFKTLLSLVKGDVGLGNVDNTSDATKNSATATLTNKTIDTAGPNTIKINGNTLSASTGTATVTFPNSTDTLVGRNTTDALTNKTVTSLLGSAASSFTAVTQSARDNSTKLATTAYVDGSTREKLTGNRTYYVSTTGSDTLNNGLSSGSPFATIQKAWDVICGTLDLYGFTATISVADGTYSSGISTSKSPVGGTVFIVGNLTTWSNVLLSTTSASCFTFGGKGILVNIRGMKLATTTSGSALLASAPGSQIQFSSIEFGACADYHLFATNGGVINAANAYTISGSAAGHIRSDSPGSLVSMVNFTVTITGTPAFSVFAYCFFLAGISIWTTVFSGSATGSRYNISGNSVVYVFGASTSYLPGNAAGVTSTGGQYE